MSSQRINFWDGLPLFLGMSVAGAAVVFASSSTLAALAHGAGWQGETKWLLPASLDVGAMAAVWCWLRPSFPAAATVFAKRFALVASLGTLVGNAAGHLLTTGHLTPGPVLIVIVGAVPAVVLVALVHLAALLLTDRSAPVEVAPIATTDQSTDPRSTTNATGTGGPETPPAPVDRNPDPIESTRRPPVESSIGSGAEPDPTPVGKPAGSTPTRSGVSANRADPIGPGSTAPDQADRADQETDGSGSRSTPIRSVPTDWKRPAGADPILISAISYAVGEGWISRPITSTDVRAVCSVGRPRDSEIRDQANAWFEDLDRERAELAAKETPATDGAEETEVAHG